MDYESFIKLIDNYVSAKKIEAKIMYKDPKEVERVNKMLDQKLFHTKKVVLYVIDLAKKLNLHLNFEKIAMASGLFHDIGRFNQGLLYRNFNDSMVFSEGKNHGDYGYELITSSPDEIKIFDEVVETKSRPAVATTVRLHQANVLPEEFNKHIDESLTKVDPEEILTGSYNFSEYEKLIVSTLLHMVRDADRIDILSQRATGDIKAITDNVNIVNKGSVSDLAKRWGVSEKIIRDNNSEEVLSNNSHIIIPRKDIPVDKLFVSEELFNRMKNLENIDLRTLQKDPDYTFITALWWSIYTFLKDMNFVGNLRQIKERELLDQIYARYPKEYQPLIDEIFRFAKEVLIDEQIQNSNDEIYVNRKR